MCCLRSRSRSWSSDPLIEPEREHDGDYSKVGKTSNELIRLGRQETDIGKDAAHPEEAQHSCQSQAPSNEC
jgi:hypothetical protein